MNSIKAFGANSPEEKLKPLSIIRREIGPADVEISIQFCGVCHSDLHTVRDEWGGTIYPSVPGHEIVGFVTQIGKDVKKFKVNDQVGVGCLVDSCRTCESCQDGLEQYCEKGATQTYNAHEKQLDQQTFGGYSERIVVDENFVLSIPENLDLAATAPLLCAGITTYSPLRHWNVGKGTKVGIVGIGGLGHMGVKIAKAMGAHVVVITTSPSKVEDAKRLGADEIILSTEKDQMKKNANSLDFILDCVSAQHDINSYLRLLKRDGSLTLVGAPEKPLPVSPFSLIPGRKSFAGSMIGGIQETQEMLDFCGKHEIVSDIELIEMQAINDAYDRLLKGDVKYRFVIDMSTLNG
ncbi:NAD(P)-dependent alcohol dehydrogenase [Belliella kenyensis]|uniref:NAD(P)-dependent alcohol dehydrogenase n=1 Tax=Belliella kenyensis TaxID=1472724 RepID=A0ABV8EIU7_9BACT|nr:NAD(P)-dependent alcohol dehydrogenase [Belliella kenyensis]MCH7400329.1 NAD(P)-dependent alcohol dehydrogenase [Belliella kenyensis]MDN3604653.1 NAD(P)-dependent alcohol dehydrogenase [Belliella kenyensis]